MEYSKRIMMLQESMTLAISSLALELKNKGKNIISFSTGEPDFDTPQIVKDEAIRAINSGFTKYTKVAGIPELLQTISNKLIKENQLGYLPDEIIVSNGAKQALFNVISALIDKDDEVIIPSPYWVTYPELVNYCGGKNIIIETDESSGFKITPMQLKNAITKKTKILILTSPSNPTGAVYSKDEIEALYEVLKDTNIIILSDEIYEKLVYDNATFTSVGSINDDMLHRTITLNGLSKSLSMTGWRIGYAASKNKELIKLLNNLQSQSTTNINSITQKAAIVGLNGDAKMDIENFCSIFENRRNLAFDMIKKISKLSVTLPQGAFYLFINIKNVNEDSMSFCKDLLEKEGVALVPGIAFGADGYVRLSFACSEEQITEGIKRISTYISAIKP